MEWYGAALGARPNDLVDFFSISGIGGIFVLATFGLCVGALFGSESRHEIASKITASLLVLALLFVLGLHRYILNLYAYTPQLQFRAIPSAD